MITIFERVQKILMKQYSLASERITPESTLESLGLDSLDLIELLFEVEDEFKIRIPQDGSTALQAATVQDVVDMIQKLLPGDQAVQPAEGQAP